VTPNGPATQVDSRAVGPARCYWRDHVFGGVTDPDADPVATIPFWRDLL